jgi:3-dehydrosphinganine reductase
MNEQPQHAIITGGSSGIGKAVAQSLARQGANISIIARTPAQLEVAKAQIEAMYVHPAQQVLALPADVSEQKQAEEAIRAASAELGSPDWLITCAGMAHPGYFQELSLEIFEQTMAVNYFGTLYCIRAALPAMKQRRQGRIVLISSGAGLIGIYGYSAYSPSKFALRGLAESLRGELKPLGIGVSIVYPPDTDTLQLSEENKTKPPETKRITATVKPWSAEKVAHEIVVGMQRKSFAIAPGLGISFLARFHSLLASGLNWYFDQLIVQSNPNENRHENQ